MAVPDPNPNSPRFLQPEYDEVSRTGTITLKWTHTLQYAPLTSEYRLEYKVDDDDFSSGATKVNIGRWLDKAEYSTTFAQGTIYLRIRAVKIVDTPQNNFEGNYYYSDWTYHRFEIDFQAPAGGERFVKPLESNRKKRVPAIYGRFYRDEVNSKIGNGLALGYLTKFTPALVYSIADHPIRKVDGLYVPAPSGEQVPLRVSHFTAPAAASSFPQVLWEADKDTNTWRGFIYFWPSADPLRPPFHPNQTQLEGDWRATDYENLTDRDLATTAKLQRLWSQTYNAGAAGPKKQYAGGSAWEYHDPEEILTDVITGSDHLDIYMQYANVDELAAGSIDTIGQYLVWYVDPNDLTKFNTARVGDFIPAAKWRLNEWRVTGPFLSRWVNQADEPVNRVFAYEIYAKAALKDSIPGTDLVKIGAHRLLLYQRFDAKEQQNALEAFVACEGYKYGSWLTSFDDGNQPNWLLTQYNKSSDLAIEEPCFMIVSAFIDRLGQSVSDINTSSFVNGITLARARYDVTNEDETFGSFCRNLSDMQPWTPTITASGQLKLVNYRTLIVWIPPVDETINFTDIDPNSFEVTLSDHNEILNKVSVKSRYFIERDKYIDEDDFENTTSIGQYGARKPDNGGIWQWEYVNSGNTERDSNGNATTPLIWNAVKLAMVHFLCPDKVNGITDDYHKYDDGRFAKQWAQLRFVIPGYQYMHLETGDVIQIDNASFIANNLKCFNETWTSKYFVIEEIRKTHEGVYIERAKELPAHYSFFTLRGQALTLRP